MVHDKNWTKNEMFLALLKLSIIINIVGNLVTNLKDSGGLLYLNLLFGVCFLHILRYYNLKVIEKYFYITLEILLSLIAIFYFITSTVNSLK